jgi:signal transduction histidine kinase/DNA-binding response OmpR family regulator
LIEVELVALPFEEQGTPATQVIVRNITERKQVEKTLRNAKEVADAANRAKSQFLATMSHELRTPLAAIIGYAELLEQAVTMDPLDELELLHDIGRIRTAGAHLLALINDVLDLSKIEAGHMQVNVSPLRIDLLLQAIIGTVKPLAERNGNRLELRGVNDLGIMVSDEVRLRQILLNLLSNACKFTHDGAVTLEVQVLAAEEADVGGRLRFAIRDTGIGIAPAQQSRLFRDFVQIDSSSTRKYGGTGLGLALSQRLAHLLGGAITLESEPGVGSTFTLDLPRNYAGSDLASAAVATPTGDDNPLSLAELADVESRIVLVIDDDPAICDMLPRMLAHPGLHFETAMSGDEGLELAGVLLPDLIILDVLLPDLNGWSILQRLKADPDTCAIPVLMLTICPDAENGFILGAASVLSKPVDLKSLADEMALILSSSAEVRRLLLVEDDADLRTYMRRTLEQGRWSVDEAPDAETALMLFEQHPPALAIIDLMLPGMDGIALIAALRTRPEGATLPILVVTAKDLTAEEQEQLNRSVEQVLRKGTFRSDELLRSARALVQRPATTL